MRGKWLLVCFFPLECDPVGCEWLLREGAVESVLDYSSGLFVLLSVCGDRTRVLNLIFRHCTTA